MRLPHRASLTQEAKLALRSADERECFLALVKDISHDLDLASLREKIATNVGVLVGSERTSLFLLEGPRGREMLVSRPSKAAAEFSNGGKSLSWQPPGITLSPGEGIIGRVAETGQTIRIESTNEVSKKSGQAMNRQKGCEHCSLSQMTSPPEPQQHQAY